MTQKFFSYEKTKRIPQRNLPYLAAFSEKSLIPRMAERPIQIQEVYARMKLGALEEPRQPQKPDIE